MQHLLHPGEHIGDLLPSTPQAIRRLTSSPTSGLNFAHDGTAMTQREHGRLGGLSSGPDSHERRTVAVLTLGRGDGERDTRWLAQALTALLARELAHEPRLRILPARESRRAEEALGICAGALPSGMLARMRERLGVDLIISGDCQLLED